MNLITPRANMTRRVTQGGRVINLNRGGGVLRSDVSLQALAYYGSFMQGNLQVFESLGERGPMVDTGLAWSWSRASAATYQNEAGELAQVGNDVPRFDYRDGEALGVLIETGREMHWGPTDDLTHADWIKLRGTIDQLGGTGPDGSTASFRLVDIGTSTNPVVYQDPVGLTDDQFQTVSVFVRHASVANPSYALSDRHARIQVRAKDNSAGSVYFNLLSGTITAQQLEIVEAYIEPFANGWYRIGATFDVKAGATTPRAWLTHGTPDGLPITVGDAGAYIELAYPQWARNDWAMGSYFENPNTGGVTASRQTDEPSLTLSGPVSLPASMYMDWEDQHASPADTDISAGFGGLVNSLDATQYWRFLQSNVDGNKPRIQSKDGAVNDYHFFTGLPSAPRRQAFVMAAESTPGGNWRGAVNGSYLATSSYDTTDGVLDTIELHPAPGSVRHSRSWCKEFGIWTRALTEAEMRGLSTI